MAIDPESLLAHGDFIRSLARRLVLDEQSADDVVQQTWLAAIEHPPRDSRSLPGWLSTVARNFAFMAQRGDRKVSMTEICVGIGSAVRKGFTWTKRSLSDSTGL